MPIISIKDNENSRWKRNAKKKTPQRTPTKTEKSKGEQKL